MTLKHDNFIKLSEKEDAMTLKHDNEMNAACLTNKSAHSALFISLNVCIVTTSVVITLFILNYYNPFMGFLSRSLSVFIFAVWGLSLAAALILLVRRRFKINDIK